MALPTFDKKTDIPKGFEDEYEEVDGKWAPIDRTVALDRALKEERIAREQAEKAARKAAKEAADAAARGAGATSEELEKVYKRIEANIRDEYAPVVKERDELKVENRKVKLEDKVIAEFRKGGALPIRERDFWKMHGDEFDLSTDGKPIVKAEPGKPVEKHIAGIVKQRPEWVQGTKAAGGGAGGVTTPTGASGGSGAGGKVTFEDVIKNPAAAIAQANES